MKWVLGEARELDLQMSREKSVLGRGKQDAKAPKIGMCLRSCQQEDGHKWGKDGGGADCIGSPRPW